MKLSFLFKIFVLTLSLVGVLYFIKSLDSGDVSRRMTSPDSTLNLLLGNSDRPMNWCPTKTTEIEIFTDSGESLGKVTSAVDISSLCEVMVGSFSNEEMNDKAFKKRLEARSSEGESKILEQIPDKPLFKAQGLPFQSTMLLKNIANRAKP